MSDLPRKIHNVSLHLSYILDEAGVTEKAVKKLQHAGLKIEKIGKILTNLTDANVPTYTFGSSIEATTTRELNPDVDSLFCNDAFNVIQEQHEWIWGKTNLLVHQGGDISAGHCRLEVLSARSPNVNVRSKQKLCHRGGRVFVKNVMCDTSKDFPGAVAHGPATMIRRIENVSLSSDIVSSLQCNSISKQMVPRIEHLRTKSWPTPDMLDTAEKSGFFVVPIGHRLSNDEDRELEWRISPSLTERCLVFGMNIIQIKCFVILKMLKRDLITPHVGDCISSYHLKTVLFHCVENTPKALWKEAHLCLCVNMCIYHLLVCVENKCCPNYLIPDENLLSGKIEPEQYIILENLLRTFMNSNGQYLFQIKCNNLGQKLRFRIRGLHGDKCIKNKERYLLEEQIRIVLCEQQTIGNYRASVAILFGDQRTLDMSFYVKWVENIIDKLHDLLSTGDVYTTAAAKSILKFIYSIYGALLSCLCIRNGNTVSADAISFLKRGYDSDLASGRLKHASVLLCSEKYDEAAQVLEDLDHQWNVSNVANICHCFTRKNPVGNLKAHIQCVSGCNTESEILKLFACDVMFTIHEGYCCPPALMFELFRDVGDDRKLRSHFFYMFNWMDFAVVDSIIFLYFLMYTTYGQLGKRGCQVCALLRLNCSVDIKLITHTETAYNLLGQCYEMEKMFDNALSCYRQSLNIRRRNNAAMWLVTLLVYKKYCREVRGENELR